MERKKEAAKMLESISEWLFMFMGLGIIAGAGIAYVWNKFVDNMRWPYDVIIREKRENGFYPLMDKAKVQTENGVIKMRLKREKKSTRPIPYESITKGEKGRGFIDLYSPNRDELFATKFDPASEKNKEAVVNVISDDNKYWFLLDKEDDVLRYKNRGLLASLEKFAPWIVLVIIMMAGVLVIQEVTKSNIQLAASTQGALNNIASAMNAFASKISGPSAAAVSTPPAGVPMPP